MLSTKALLCAFFGALLLAIAADALAAERGRNSCRRAERLRIQDLDTSPDPVIEGQRIRQWRVTINLEANRECDTEIEIRESREVVARDRVTLRPGTNQINIRPSASYDFRGREHCFTVVADIEGTRRDVDADRKFCARKYTGWSMREPGDPRYQYREGWSGR
jgi:hypothetical protein